MSIPKRHHFLPQKYQEGFCSDDGCVWVYDRVRDEFRPQKPINTAVISHYYSVTDDSGKKRTELESDLLQFIDGNGAEAIKKARDSVSLDAEDIARLSVFCALLKFRIPDFEKTFNHYNEQLVKFEKKGQPEHWVIISRKGSARTLGHYF